MLSEHFPEKFVTTLGNTERTQCREKLEYANIYSHAYEREI